MRRRLAEAYGVMSRIDGRDGACDAARGWGQKRDELWQEIANGDAAAFAADETKKGLPVRCGS